MAQGIRIRHHTRRSQMLPVPLFKQEFPNWRLREDCLVCDVKHQCRVIHLDLDAEGCAIVSDMIWARFQEYPNQMGFTVTNVIQKPPAQGVQMNVLKVSDIIQGVDVGGILSSNGSPARAIFDIGGNGSGGKMTQAEVDLRTVTIDEYFDIMRRHGYNTDGAGRILMKAFLKDGPELKGAH